MPAARLTWRRGTLNHPTIGWFPTAANRPGREGNVTRWTQIGRRNHGRPRDCRVARNDRPMEPTACGAAWCHPGKAPENHRKSHWALCDKPGLDASISTNRPPFAKPAREGESVPPVPWHLTPRARKPAIRQRACRPIRGAFPLCLNGGCHGAIHIIPLAPGRSGRGCVRASCHRARLRPPRWRSLST